MIKLQYIYYLLMIASFINSLFYLHIKRVKLLAVLLLLSIITEVIVEIYKYHELKFYHLYHVFSIVEYCLITLILLQGINHLWIKKVMIGSIPLFIIGGLYISMYVQSWYQLPSIIYSFEGLLIITWCLIALWSIEPHDERAIFQQPAFWFILGFYVYCICTLPFDGVYNYLLNIKTHVSKTQQLYSIINSASNYLLYTFILIGFSFYRWKKYTPR